MFVFNLNTKIQLSVIQNWRFRLSNLNEMAMRMQAVGKGIVINDEVISILLYADDVVLLAENEDDLQYLLNSLSEWCNQITCLSIA